MKWRQQTEESLPPQVDILTSPAFPDTLHMQGVRVPAMESLLYPWRFSTWRFRKIFNLRRVSRDRRLSTADPYPLHMEGNGRVWEENEVACWLNRTRNFKNTHLGIRANELNGIFYRVSMHRFPCACSPAQRPLSTCFLVANRREKNTTQYPKDLFSSLYLNYME